MRGAAYLSKSPDGVYYARFVVPVQQMLPGMSREFRLSTRTKDPKAARALARHLRTCYEHFLLQNVPYTRERAIAHLQAHMPKKPDNLPMPFGLVITAPNGTQVQLTDLTAADVAQSGGMDALIASAYNSTQGSTSTVAVWERPEDAQEPPTKPNEPVESPRLSPLSRKTVGALYKDFIEYETARAPVDKVGIKRVPQIKTRLKPFIEHFGKKAIQTLNAFDMETYARALAYYPVNLDKLPDYQKLTFAEIVELSKARKILNSHGEPALTLARNTHSGYITDAVNFIKYCRKRNAADLTLIEGLKQKVPNLREGVERRAFNQAEMQQIFDSEYYREGRYNVPHQYWIPLIAAFTGARCNEIAQMSPFDVKQDSEGLWYFDITTTTDDGKSLKNKESKRIVPLHDTLLAHGLVAYVEMQKAANAKNLFNLVATKADKFSKEPSRWFNETYLRDYLKIANVEVVFHSFRHRFITSLAQAIFDNSDVKGELILSTTPALILRRMVGHSVASALTAGRSDDVHTNTYTGALTIRSMKRVIDLLNYPNVVFHKYKAPDDAKRQRMKKPIGKAGSFEISSEDFSKLFG
jgi:integrase